MAPDLKVLNVLLHRQEIGTLTLLPNERVLFAFNQNYINDVERRILSLSFKDSMGELITDIPQTRTRVPPFFANILPEGPMRDYLARQAGVNARREFFLLWVLGRDLPGDLIITPPNGEAWPNQHSGGDDDHDEGIPAKRRLRFSLAGVQLKFSAVMEATGGLTIPAEGVGGAWIVKLPSTRFERVPENEYSMMVLAKAVGIDVPEVQLVPLQEISGLPQEVGRVTGDALAVKRFDRLEDGSAVHMEDFAQIFNVYPEDKYKRASYKNIAQVVWAEVGEEGIAEFVRRLIFSTLIGNADMHLKNWSLIYPDGRSAALSPGYDFVSTIAFLPDEYMALNFARSKRMTDLTIDELSYLAAKAGLPEKLVQDTAAETVERFRQEWMRQHSHLPLTGAAIDIINKQIAKIPLAAGN